MNYWDTDAQNYGVPSRWRWKPGVLPRRDDLVYGGDEAGRLGFAPVHETIPDKLIDPRDYKEVIQHCHDEKIFPMYHQTNSWAPEGTVYNQDGIGYCWTFGGTAAVMDTRAMEDKDTVVLGAVSMGWLVNWQDRGNYLESFITGAKQRGIAPADMCGGLNSVDRNYRNYLPGWEEEALNYRLDDVWDTDGRSGKATMIQHCLSILAYGRPLELAHNWWGHALEGVGLEWDETQKHNLVWVKRNSHGERNYIRQTGDNAVPDEAYGFITTVAA